MKASAKELEVKLDAADCAVHMILRCDSAYEAAILYDDITLRARSESLIIDFGLTKIRKT